MTNLAHAIAGCAGCGTLQRVPGESRPWNVLRCAGCDGVLTRRNGRSLDAALAFATAGLVLLVPANMLPFLGTSLAGVSRESMLASSATAMLANGYPELAVAIGLFVVVLPPLRLALLVAVLGTLRFGGGRRPRWLAPAFRLAGGLKDWAMADVFLLGFVVAVARLQVTISTQVYLGAYCFVAAGLMTLLVRATLDESQVASAIGGDVAAPVRERHPNGTARAAAFAIAAALLYIPANLYPMATLPIGLQSVEYTVLAGVVDLFDTGLWSLALLVLLASFAIPLAKLAGLAWCIASVWRGSSKRLRTKTRLYTVIAEIGRWSMVDPFVIACFVPVTHYNALIHGQAGPAAPAFTAVVVLTMLATHAFDPRALWDAARPARTP